MTPICAVRTPAYARVRDFEPMGDGEVTGSVRVHAQRILSGPKRTLAEQYA